MKQSNLFLIGPMGAGKTTIGRQLASQLRLPFIDSDHEIEERTGVSIPTIFEIEGETGFRERERTVIDHLSLQNGIILATGGGAVLHEENRRHLMARGLVIYLHCLPRQQFERTRHDKNRPLLQTEKPLERLTQLFEQRDPLYRSIADLVVATGNRQTAQVVKEIVRYFHAYRHPQEIS